MGSPGASGRMSHAPLGLYPDWAPKRLGLYWMAHDRAAFPVLRVTRVEASVRVRLCCQTNSQPAATGWRRLGAACGLTAVGFGRRNGRWRLKTASINSGGPFLDAAPTPRCSSRVARSSGTSQRFARFNHSNSFKRLSNSARRRRRSVRISVRINGFITQSGNLGNFGRN